MLNEWFKVPGYNPDLHTETREIKIGDAYYAKRNYLYQKQESKPIFLGTNYIHTENEYKAEYFDFIVEIPKKYAYNEAELKSLINYYKLAGKKYKISTI